MQPFRSTTNLYRSSASSRTLRLKRVCSWTPRRRSVDAWAARKAVTRACTFAQRAGRCSSWPGAIVSVRPWSSLRIPSRVSGITMLRHATHKLDYA
ncbi:hypothetical protein M438DRAFT_140529 [Aureobasidium pullulans EXF-150]|uniref:Uncharacterized protein n=1 Tax=Aureobasidium pullulans EXF-150 TaxID=1043002 RepID=A0A074XRQ6_AURPU|nr:uncharacterized protein M438DRAFT_140529 [Aureobasidium pullulans EXF-150]KEQ88130.1 hypothetical protein M438DRAFT_140529 [Aureobasidium pullulans EXF-150]